MSNNNGKNQPPVKTISEEAFKQMLLNQAKSLELQDKKILLEESNQQRQFEYACKALDVQKDYLKERPKELRKTATRVSIILGSSWSFFWCFLVFASTIIRSR